MEIDHALTFDFSTPHTQWAKPYALGKTRVLFFSDGRGTIPRECVELMQRFDIEAQAVFWANINDTPQTDWHGGKDGKLRMLRLLRENWDCFVFLKCSLNDVPIEQKTLLLDAVKRGAGLVFCGAEGANTLNGKTAAVPSQTFLYPEDETKAFALGKGRGIVLPDRPQIDYYEGWEIDYDYWQERFGRALLWAAAKEPTRRLSLTVSPTHKMGAIDRHLEVLWTGSPTKNGEKLQTTLRCPGHRPIQFAEKAVDSTNHATYSLPNLPEGLWHADVQLIGAKGAVTWGTQSFEVHSDRKISGVRFYQDWSEPGGAILGQVVLSGPMQGDETVRVQLLDRRRRILARQDFKASKEPIHFRFPAHNWLPMLVTVEAQLLSDSQELSRKYSYFHVAKRKQHQFNFLMWGAPQTTLAPYVEENLARNGVTLQLDWRSPPLQVNAFDIAWVPFSHHVTTEKTAEGIMKPFCWNDSLQVDRHVKIIVNAQQTSRQRGTFVYSLGDENKTQGSCLSNYCRFSYQTFLRESYGTLEDLNYSWGTNFTDWREIGLSVPMDDEESASKTSKNYPRWFSRQAYKSWNYVKHLQKYAAGFQKIDPQAKSGFDGAGRFASGDDLDLIIRSVDSWVPYTGPVEEVIRSVAPRDFVRSTWIGGRDKTAGPLLYKYWRTVNLGADSIWWWMWSCIGSLHGFLAPDLRPFPEAAEVVKDTQIIRDGLGDLLLKSGMQDDGIAILYSYPSVFAHKLDSGDTYGSYEDAHAALIKFIRDSGLQFRYVTDRMLRMGEVDLSRYRVLFLPRSEAIGEREAMAIRRFVENGGTVVADFRTGIFDDHCKPRGKGALDDLFGVALDGGIGVRKISFGKAGAGTKAVADGGIVLKGGVAELTIEGTPVLINHRDAKGKAILLNLPMAELPKLYPSAAARRVFFGFEPPVKVAGKDGRRPEDLMTTTWRDKGVEIFSLLGRGKANEEVTVTIPDNRYVHDLRKGKVYGPCKEFATTLYPDRASFFILTKSPEPEPLLKLEATTVKQGEVMKAVVSVPGAEGLHAFKFSVEAGERRLEWNDRPLVVGDSPMTVEIPIAYNDPAGDCRVVLTDLFTGNKRSYPFKVVE